MNRISEIFKKRANECYKENNNGKDCMVESSNTIKLHPWCDQCKKIRKFTPKFINKKDGSDTLKLPLKEEKLQSKEIETPNYSIKKFKFPIDLIEFPIKNSNKFIKRQYEGASDIELYLKGNYGKYLIKSPREYRLMDIRTLLTTLYFADYHKNCSYEEKFTRWLDLLELKSSGFYRKSIIEGLDYLKNTTFYTPYIYDLENKQRSFSFNLTDKGEIDYLNLPSFSVWSILDSYHHKVESKRKASIKIRIGKEFYERIYKDNYFTLIDIKKILPLKDIALNLYLLIKRQDPRYIKNYTVDFKTLKAQIGITDKHITNARKTFEKAWSDIKDRELLKGYRHKIFISKKNGGEYIKFVKQRGLRS